jgi:hypothetical protein
VLTWPYRIGGINSPQATRVDVRPSSLGDLNVPGNGEGRRLTLRGGRQEMFYGSSRLIDVRQGPNVRRSFDSVRALLKWGDWRIDGIAARPVRNKDGVADNDTDHTQALWGIYGASKQNIIPGASLRTKRPNTCKAAITK